MDWNGDGRRDVLVAQSNGELGVVLSTGTGLSSTVSNTSYSTASVQFTAAPNLTGDGQDGLLSWNGTSATFYLHNSPGAPPDLLSSVIDGYGNSASPSYVSIAQGSYSPGTGATFPYQNFIGPMEVVSEVVYSDPSMVSGSGATFDQTFEYSGAVVHVEGRGFQGFQSIETTDSRYVSPNNLNDYQYFETTFPWSGMQYQHLSSTGSFYPMQAVGTPNTLTQATLSSAANEERYFPYFTNWTVSQREVGGTENGALITTSSTSYAFDSYGNATSIATTVTDKDPNSPYMNLSWTTTTTNTTDISQNPSPDLAAWCLRLIDETQVTYTAPGSPTVTRTKTFTPDTPALCRIKTITTEPTANAGAYKVTEALTFDSFGNVATDTVTGATMPASPASRESLFNWGTTGQFLNTFTDPSGALITWSYTSNQALTFGVPDSKTDPNNLITSWSYDGFGHKFNETRPDGTITTWAWSLCSSYCGWSNSVYQVLQTLYPKGGTAIRTDAVFYDPIDRVTETSGPNVTGSTVIVQTLYNSLGLLAQQSMPFLSGASTYQTTFGYDLVNRIRSVTRPISSTNSMLQSTLYNYAGRTSTVTDPFSNNQTIITDVNGWMRQVQDGIGYTITRTYDAAGSLTGVTDSVGNTLLSGVNYAYGIKPFLLSATDADRGAWTYTVDSLGERIGWTDANVNSFSMTYDALSRPLSRSEPDLFTQWQYGSTPGSHNVGQLIYECTGTSTTCVPSSGYAETHTFDFVGRLSTGSITEGGNPGNDPGGVFKFTFAYDPATGFLSTLTYPMSTSGVALNLQYGYQYGILQSVIDTTDTAVTCGVTCTLWTANAMNEFGEVTEETLGNGVVTNRTFDDVTALLNRATAGVGGGTGILNQTYSYYETGNLKLRQNNTLGLNESFSYDADLRLTCTALASTCTTPTIVYDGGSAGPGNITSMTGVGTYTYPAVGQPRPHAVTGLTGTFNGITNPSFAYDLNGNMTKRASATANITWASYNYPLVIAATDVTGSEEVQLFYGPDRQRWEQIYTGPGTTEKTFYIGGLMDLVSGGGATNYRHYIYAGGEPVAVYSRSGTGVNTMNYMLSDHEGSVAAIASNSGSPEVDESFTPFGQRRNPLTWSGAPTSTDLNTIAGISRQGYTFQTWLGQSMGLNHMNGRVEDAILGRMISPDPHITDPTNAQNYNRYSYVINNPLNLVDPTGFDDDDGSPGYNGGGNNGGSGNGYPPPPPPPCTGSLLQPCNSGSFNTVPSWAIPSLGGGGGGSWVTSSSSGDWVDSDGSDGTVGTYTLSLTQTWVPYFMPTPAGFGAFPTPQWSGQTSPALPEIVVTGSRRAQSQNPIKNWLCNAGNSLATGADTLGSASGKLELTGVGVGVAGLVTAQPEVAGPGFAMAAAGGLGSIGAGALQLGAGLLQGFGGGGFGNSFSALATLGAGATIGSFFRGPGVSGYQTVSQRATNSFLQNSATTAGGVFDTLTGFLEQLGPQQVSCP